MGTFASYHGSTFIPEELREQFSEHMMKILNYGGMMQLEEVKIYGRKLYLLKPVKIYPGGEVDFHYNYFEDDSWENAGFNASKAELWSNKIGSQEFNTVMLAAYTLYELYNPNQGFATVNDEIVEAYNIVAWINHLLGTEYTLEKRISKLWELAENYVLTDDGINSGDLSYGKLMQIIPRELRKAAGGLDLTDLCYIINGTESLETSDVRQGTYPADVLECKNRIRRYFESTEKQNPEEALWNLLLRDKTQRTVISEPKLQEVAEMTIFLPARVIVYLTSELREQEFWGNWSKLRTSVYHDEEVKGYATPELTDLRNKILSEPISGLRTSEFLHEDGWFTFYSTPEELRDKPKYFVSDDDRLYWWDGRDEVIISDKTDSWLKKLAERHAVLMTDIDTNKSNYEAETYSFVKDFIVLLAEIEDTYKRIFPFQDMFYEFMQNGNKKEFQAAVALLHELSEENKNEGNAIRYMSHSWDMNSRKVTFNPGRIRIKRFMSVMANRELRSMYFNF